MIDNYGINPLTGKPVVVGSWRRFLYNWRKDGAADRIYKDWHKAEEWKAGYEAAKRVCHEHL